MKPFLVTLYAVFLFAMVIGFYVAHRESEALVEDNYYEKATGYFTTRELEDSLGLKILLPDVFRKGENEVIVKLFEQDEPLRGAEVFFSACGVKDDRYDTTLAMTETEPGVYRAGITLPYHGKCLMKVDVATSSINTGRKWFTDIR